MEPWLACRVTLYAYRRKRAIVAMRTWFDPGVGTRRVLLLRGADGTVFQVVGSVVKAAAKEGYYNVEVQIPWAAALSLAAWAGKTVREGGATVLHSYAARVKGAAPPPLRLIYEGYLALYGTFIYKVLDVPTGIYYVELRLGDASLLVPAKYYRHERRNRRVGGDSGIFQLPIDVYRTLVEWGFHELGADYDYVYVRIWRPNTSAAQQAESAAASW